MNAVDAVYGASWLEKQRDMLHPIARCMHRRWNLAIRTIAEAADLIIAVRRARAGAQSLISRLQSAEEYVGALCEARVARWLVGQDLSFEFSCRKGVVWPDIQVHHDRPFTIEVKHLGPSQRDQIDEHLTSYIWRALGPTLPGSSLHFDWSGDEVRALQVRDGFSNALYSSLDELANRALLSIESALRDPSQPAALTIPIPGIGTVDILRGTTSLSEMHGETFVDPSRTEDRVAHLISDATTQIAQCAPGIIVLGMEPGPVAPERTIEHVARLLAECGQGWRGVSGAILLVVSQRDAIVEETWPVPNPWADTPLNDLPLRRARQPERTAYFEEIEDLFAS